MQWTEADIARLRAMYDRGDSFGVIARALRVSKNAVVGRAHRSGFPPRGNPTKPRIASDVAARVVALVDSGFTLTRASQVTGLSFHGARSCVKRATQTKPARLVVVAREPVRVCPKPVIAPPPARPATPIGAMQSGVRQCQFPLWPHAARPGPNPLFCGAPVAARCYCEAHFLLTHIMPRARPSLDEAA